jgi:Ca2+-binding RTX toxin-like protein
MEQLSNIADGNTFKITIDNSNDLYDVAQIDIVVEDSANKFTDIVSTLNADASFNVNYEASKVDYNGDGTDDVITIKAKSAGVADFSATVQLESGTTATVNSESLDNKFEGLGGDDSLSGRSGDDSLLGGAGDDNLKGGIGNDTLDGGTHTLAATGDGNGAVANNAGDTADYSERTQSINATLSAGDGSVTVDLTGNGFGAGDEVDSLLRIENITGGSNDDVISGDELNNTLKGNSGDDTLSGGLGKDYIDGGFHTSGGVQDTGTPDSGRGDTVSYEYLTVSNQSVEVNLIDELAKEKDGSTTYEDTVRNIENVIASEQDDTITGNSTNNTLDGNKGSDTFYRSAGDDTINGGTSESGDKDIVDYSVHGGDTTNTTTTAAITLTATNAVYSVAKSDGGTDTLTEIEEVRGSDSNDTMTGDTTNATADTFYGGAGKDTLEGGAGDDNLSGEAGDDIFKATGIQDGADTIDGGANGSDTVDYSAITDSDNNSAEGGLKITLNDTLAADFDLDADEDGTFSNDDNNDTITNVENVTGTQNDDEITGDDKDNTLKGEGGDDTLVGGKGNDTLDGGTTNETDGDWVDYDYLTEQSVVTVDGVDTKAKGVAVNIGDTDKFGVTKESAKDINTGSEVGSDSITNIENIKGSKNDDTLIGSSGDNTLDGGAGRDTLSGGDGDDFLQGGDGIDIADYSDATEDLTVNIADGDNKFISTSQGSDSFRNIEGVIGGSGNDTLEGSTGANELKGSGGDDTLLGYGASTGTDILDGGTEGDLGDFVSFDYLDSGKSAVIDLADGNVQDILAGSGVDNVQLIDIENALGGKGNDTIYGSSDRNIISGNDGADALVGRSGADIIIGGSSESDNEINAGDGNKRFVDTIDYGTDSNANFAVTVNMEAVQKQVVNDGYKDDSDGAKTSDTIYGIENIVGSGYDDKFTGASNARAHISGSLEQLKTLSNGEVFTITIGGQSATATVDGTYTDSNKLEKIVDAFNNDTDVNGDYTAYAIDYNGDGKEDVITIVGNDESAFTITFDKNGTSTSINSESLDNKFEGKVGNDTLSGKAGDDILEGGDGDDLIRGGIGNDTIRGGNQTQADNSQGDSSTKEGHGDTLDYSERNQSVVLTNLDAGDGSATVGGTETDTIYGIENIIGSQVADEIEGDDLNNTLKGEAGDDTLSGQNGNDVIEAGAGDDTLSGGLGDDTLNGGTTNDTDGDYVDYTYLDTAGGSTGARINLTAGQSVDIGVGSQVGTDTISNIENVEGSKFADIITGEGDDNTLKGNLGSDTFYRSAGNDEIIGGTGDVDIVDYSVHNGDTTNVTVTDKVIVTASGSTYSVAKNDGGTDTLTQIEQIRGSDKADQMTGDSASDSFFGADNADVLEGKGGNDYLDGEAGNDTFNATRLDGTTSDGDDAYVGGIGTDTVNYNVLQAGDEDSGDTRDVGNGADSSTPASDAYDGVEIDLNSGSQRVHRLFGSDSFNGVENIHGTIFKDYIKGDASDNEFFGNEEDDVLEGKAGADTLHGGSGNDLIIGGADDGDDNGDLLNGGTGSDTFKQNDGETSNDVIDGGEESGEIIGSNIINDIVDYSALTVDAEDIGVELTLNNDTASDVRVTTQLFDHKIKNIENIKGTTGKDSIVGDDDKNTLWGETGADTLRGGAEDDILYGGDGKDVLHGGTGDDQLIGGDGVDTADYSDATNDIAVNITDGQKTIAGFGTDTFSSIEGVIGGSGNDTLTGNKKENTLIGGAGDDTLLGGGTSDGGGIDKLIGGANGVGGDFASFNYTSTGMKIDLANTAEQDSDQDNTNDLQIDGIEHAEGGAGNDTLYGNASDNTLRGLAGNDTLYGQAGDDTLDGGIDSGYKLTFSFAKESYSFTIHNSDSSTTSTITYDASGSSNIGSTLQIEILEALVAQFNASADAKSLGSVMTDGTFIFILTEETVDNQSANITDVASESYKDIADYSNITSNDSISVDMSDATQVTDNTGGNDTLIDIEKVIGSKNNDTFTNIGDGDIHEFDGFNGDDTFNLKTNTTEDTIIGGAGNNDTVSYASMTDAQYIDIDLLDDGASSTVNIKNADTSNYGTDKIETIEHITGGAGDDTIKGNNLVNTLIGEAGDDSIDGEDGNDSLVGGAGDDTFIGGAGDDTIEGGTHTINVDGDQGISDAHNAKGDGVDYSGRTESIKITLSNSSGTVFVDTVDDATDGNSSHEFNSNDERDTISGIENITGGQNDDTIFGDNSKNTLIGGNGNDTLSGGLGNDVLEGGDHTGTQDTADYSYLNSSSKLVVDLSGSGDDSATVSTGESDVLRGIENIVGGDADDTITGDAGINTLEGGKSSDTLQGGEGNDTLDGGDGTDTVDYRDATGSLNV